MPCRSTLRSATHPTDAAAAAQPRSRRVRAYSPESPCRQGRSSIPIAAGGHRLVKSLGYLARNWRLSKTEVMTTSPTGQSGESISANARYFLDHLREYQRSVAEI